MCDYAKHIKVKSEPTATSTRPPQKKLNNGIFGENKTPQRIGCTIGLKDWCHVNKSLWEVVNVALLYIGLSSDGLWQKECFSYH